jgi:hypothetical protein
VFATLKNEVCAGLLFRSEAQTDTRLIQAGLVKCGTNAGLDGTCSLSNNLVKFVEILNSSGYHCYAHGDASTGTEYVPSVHITLQHGRSPDRSYA